MGGPEGSPYRFDHAGVRIQAAGQTREPAYLLALTEDNEEGNKEINSAYAGLARRPSTGWKLTRRREPVAAASLSSVLSEGRVRPLSSRATTGWVVPILRANSS